MVREILLLLAGLALLGVGLYLTHTKVVAIQVGSHTSRLVGIVCAILAYYYLRHSFSLRMTQGAWTLQKVLETIKVWLPPALLFGMAAYYVVSTARNWHSEFMELIKSTAWMAVSAALIVAARYVLAL